MFSFRDFFELGEIVLCCLYCCILFFLLIQFSLIVIELLADQKLYVSALSLLGVILPIEMPSCCYVFSRIFRTF